MVILYRDLPPQPLNRERWMALWKVARVDYRLDHLITITIDDEIESEGFKFEPGCYAYDKSIHAYPVDTCIR
jgi:hypothetical protein